MAKQRLVCFNEEGFRRAQEAINRVRRTPAEGARRRRQSAVLSGGSSTNHVKFTIVAYDPYTTGFTCLIRYRPCGVLKVSGEDDSGQITVYDVDGCYFDDEATDDLIGRKGDAYLMVADISEDPEQLCLWVVSSLCCPP